MDEQHREGEAPPEYTYLTPSQLADLERRIALGREMAPLYAREAAQYVYAGDAERAQAFWNLAKAAYHCVPRWDEVAEAMHVGVMPSEEFVETVEFFHEVEQWQRDRTQHHSPVRCEARHRRVVSHARPRERRAGVRRVSRVSSGSSPDDPAPGDLPLAAFDGRDLRRLVELALDTLPADGASWRAWERLESEIRWRLGSNPETDS